MLAPMRAELWEGTVQSPHQVQMGWRQFDVSSILHDGDLDCTTSLVASSYVMNKVMARRFMLVVTEPSRTVLSILYGLNGMPKYGSSVAYFLSCHYSGSADTAIDRPLTSNTRGKIYTGQIPHDCRNEAELIDGVFL